MDDLIKYADNEQLGGIVASLDYKKPFTLCIIAALKKFNFGAQFIKFISAILSKTESAVKNGGWLFEWFQKDRGVRQGCCVSPLLFVLVVGLLAKKNRHKEDTKGILNDSAIKDDLKLLQYDSAAKTESDLKEALMSCGDSYFLKNIRALTKHENNPKVCGWVATKTSRMGVKK